ncbi:RNA polymerase I-specific transcription initiation factor rrn11 [Schizosaccharomyces pombe]
MFSPCTVKEKRSTLRSVAPNPESSVIPPIPLPSRRYKTRHIDALCSLMHLCLLRKDYPRASRAFSLLLRSKSVDISKLWNIGLEILNKVNPEASSEYMERLIARYPARPSITNSYPNRNAEHFFPAYIMLLIQRQEYNKAMKLLDEYLLLPPYNQNPALHEYSGMLCFELAKEEASESERTKWIEKAKYNFSNAGIDVEL